LFFWFKGCTFVSTIQQYLDIMKSFFFFSLLCIGLLTNNIIYAQCDWQDLGPSDTNTVRNEAVSFSDMALDNNDHPYTVFSDGRLREQLVFQRV